MKSQNIVKTHWLIWVVFISAHMAQSYELTRLTNQKRAREGREDALPALALFSLVHLHSDLIQTYKSVIFKQYSLVA